MMKQNEVAALLKAYHASKIAADKAKDMAATIKAEIASRGGEPLEAGGFIAKATTCKKKAFDTTRFRADHPNLYEQYLKESTETRLYFK